MASLSSTLQIILAANNAASGPIEDADNSLQRLLRSLNQNAFTSTSQDVDAFRDALVKLSSPLASVAASALKTQFAFNALATSIAVLAFNASKDAESAFLDLRKVLNDTDPPAQELVSSFNELAIAYGQAGNALVQGGANFIQAGFSASEAVGLVEDSIKLLIAGELEAKESSDLLVATLKGFGAQASDASRLVDVLNAVSNRYATNVRELAIGMAALSPIAAAANLDFEQTAGILTPVIEVFRSGSEAANALKTGLLKLVDDAKPVQDALASIGVSQFDTNGALRTGASILLDVSKAFLDLDDSQKLFITSQIVGIDQAARMVKVFDGLAKSTEITVTAQQAAGSASEEVGVRLQAAEVAASRTAEAFRQLSVSIGNQYKEQVAGVVTATGELFAAIDRAAQGGALDGLLNIFRDQVVAIQELIASVAKNIESVLGNIDYSQLQAGLEQLSGELGDLFSELFSGFDITTAEGLEKFLQLMVDRLGNMATFTAGVIDQLEPFADILNLLFGTLENGNNEVARFAGELSGLSLTVNTLGPALLDMFSGMLSGIGTIVELTFKIGLLVAGLKVLSIVTGGNVVAAFTGMLAAIVRLPVGIAALITAVTGLQGAMLGLSAAAAGLGYVLGTVLNDAIEKLTGVSIGAAIADAAEAISGASEEFTRLATEAEIAAVRQRRLAEEAENQAQQERALQEAIQARLQANKDLLEISEEQRRTQELLTEAFRQQGLVYDEVTGKLTRIGEQTAAQARAQESLQNVLRELGDNFVISANLITKGGEEIINGFKRLGLEAGATSAIIQAAFDEAVDEAKTLAELDSLSNAYRQFGEQGKLSAQQIEQGLQHLSGRQQQLIVETGELSKAFAQAGLTTSAELQKAAADAKALLQQTLQQKAAEQDRTTAFLNFVNAQRAAYENASAAQRALAEEEIKRLAIQGQISGEVQKSAGVQSLYADATEKNTQTQIRAVKVQDELAKKTKQTTEESARLTAEQFKAERSGAGLFELWNKMIGTLQQLGGNALPEFMRRMGSVAIEQRHVSEESARLDKEINSLLDTINFNTKGLGSFSIIGRFKDMVQVYHEVLLESLQLQKRSEDLAATLETAFESGVIGAGQLDQAIAFARTAVGRLDDARLDRLTSTIREVEDAIESLRDQVAETVRDSEVELLRLKGLDVEADRREAELEHQQRLIELEALREQARKTGQNDLLRQLDLEVRKQKEILELTLEQIERDASDNGANTRTSSGSGGTTASGTAPQTTNFNFNGAVLDGERLAEEINTILKRQEFLSA